MIRFLIKGLIRDRHRSLFPVITVTLGVMLTVIMHCWVTGVIGDMIDFNARFVTGHVKVTTRAYAENLEQNPNDLALLGVDELTDSLQAACPDMKWIQRIRFGALVDVPDGNGETRAQGTAIGFGIDLLSGPSEIQRMGIAESIVRGGLPGAPGEILISEGLSQRLEINPGETLTLLGSTMFGAMTMQNFTVSGTLVFGIQALDRGALISDIKDIRQMMDMQDAAGEILGFFGSHRYSHEASVNMKQKFNAAFSDTTDEFSPVMLTLRDQNDLGSLLDYAKSMVSIMIFVFVLAISIVLWNAGLIGGIRRYGEIGVRLAIGEDKGHLYRSMIGESLAIGIFGSILGTVIGLAISWYMETYGISIGGLMQNATMMLPNRFHGAITDPAYFIGFLPGLFSTVLGTTLSGFGIYRRQTASLFKELET